MRKDKIHTNIFRRVLVTLVVAVTAMSAMASATRWEASDARRPGGSGSENDPYIIATGANLYWLSLNIANEGSKYYVQTADIDLEGREWMPIGNSGAGGFTGHYDGQGHTITGLRVDWGDYALALKTATSIDQSNILKNQSANIAYGLFGYLAGSVENLVIDGAHIYQSALSAKKSYNVDLRVGVLAGSVGSNKDIAIRNIIIRNSRITDVADDVEAHHFFAHAYMIGGLIGDLHGEGYTSTTPPPDVKYNISNIYCQVDVDVSHTKLASERDFDNKGQQYYVGGFIGRARSLKISAHMPHDVIYSGTVNAPLASVGPIFASGRYGTAAVVNTYEGIVIGYAGDFVANNNGVSTTSGDFPTAYFHDYKIYDYSDAANASNPPLVDIDPSNLNANTMETFTLAAQPASSPEFTKTAITPQVMATLQGVNRGVRLEASSFKDTAEGLSTGGFDWDFAGSNRKMEREEEITLSLSQTGFTSTLATFSTSRVPTQGYSLRWYYVNGAGDVTLLTDNITQEIGTSSGSSSLTYLPTTSTERLMVVLFDGGKPLESKVIDLVQYIWADMVIEPVGNGLFNRVTPRILDNGVVSNPEGWSLQMVLMDASGTEVIRLPFTGYEPIQLDPMVVEARLKVVATHTTLGELRSEVKTLANYAKISTAREVVSSGLRTHVQFVTAEGAVVPTEYLLNEQWTVYRGSVEYPDVPCEKIRDTDEFIFHWKDHSFVTRDIRFRCVDRYGMVFQYNIPRSSGDLVTWNRSVSNAGFQTYQLRYKWQDGPYLDPSLSSLLTYTATIDNPAIATDNLDVVDDLVKIPYLYFANHIYKINAADVYGGTYSFSNLTITPPTSVEISSLNGCYAPNFVYGSRTFFPDREAAGLTYSWQVDYKIDGVVDETRIYTDDGIKLERLCDADIKLVMTDRFGETMTAMTQFRKENVTVEVEESGESPYFTYTATVKTFTGVEVSSDEGSWQWYGVNGEIGDDISRYYPLAGQTSNVLQTDKTNNNYNAFCAVFTLGGESLVGYSAKKDVIYVYNQAATATYSASHNNKYASILATYPDGSDTNNGRTPATAVSTMARAYELLNPENGPRDNIVVLMGYVNDLEYLRQYEENNYRPYDVYKRNATVTGSYGEIETEGTLRIGFNSNSQTYGLLGATIFRELTFYGDGKSLYLYCNLNDVTIGNAVKIENYSGISRNNIGLGDYTAPDVCIIGSSHNSDNDPFTIPKGNATPGRTTITIQSGCFGRIIAGTRNDYSNNATTAEANRYNHNSYNIFGHPDNPHRVDVNIAIKHLGGANEYTPDKTPAQAYKYDIGLLVGGVTDGSIYTDSRLYMSSGSVGRFISGNISYGRPVGDAHPSDSFFGSTEMTLEGGNIGELIGGTLGRNEDGRGLSVDFCEAFFYGRSIININGGIVNGNIYGAGAGGVVGLGDDDNHTPDKLIPYLTGAVAADGRREVAYAPYNTVKGRLPVIKMLQNDDGLELDDTDGTHTILDLAKSYCEINVNAGTVEGNVYGGAFGYSFNVPYTRALDEAGNLYGNTRVRINGGLVKGNVYGGGAGDPTYHNDFYAGDTTTPLEKRTKFSNLANVFGDTYVELTGGVVEGNVYAGSQGIAGLPEMASVKGNTHLVVKNERESDNTIRTPYINGDIFGGSKLGHVTGNTNVEILGGAIGNNIYGGSEGIASGDDESMAVVGGNTSIVVKGGTYFTNEHAMKISEARRLTAAQRTFNIYGGGYQNCVVVGNTSIKITESLFSSYRNLLETDKYPTLSKCFADDSYNKFSVFGAGRGTLTDVVGNTKVDIDIVGGAEAPSSKPVDVANNQQFLLIMGGGYAGQVYGNTDLTLKGNVFARAAYGGGMYGRVEGVANLTVTGGSYNRLYGGGLLGDIKGGANLTIGTKALLADDTAAADANQGLYIYENVYGGNDVSGIVGYERSEVMWRGNQGKTYKVRYYDKATGTTGMYEYSRHVSTSLVGTNVKIYGGTIKGDVFGGGNGSHTGYYVPNNSASETHPAGYLKVKYMEGPAYLYRFDRNDPATATLSQLNEDEKRGYGLYEYRPRVSRVRIHIGGNTTTDRVNILGNVYGGGHTCTIGRFDPDKDVLVDPSRYLVGGNLKINFGSHVTVSGNVYMGSRGKIIGEQGVLADDVDPNADSASDFYYHYYDADSEEYRLGFPNTLDGRNRFHAYVKLIDMDATTQLTFYDDPYKGGLSDIPVYNVDDPEAFAANDIRWGNFFAGGARGSMTHHTTTPAPVYEYTLPKGLTVETNVVGGSEDAIIRFCEYSSDLKSFNPDKPIFSYIGGLVYDVNDGGTTGVGGGIVEWTNAPEGTPAEELRKGTSTPRGEKVVMRLNVDCEFDPQMSSYIDEHGDEYSVRYGGLVFGGCYNSGLTNGSVEVICRGNLLGRHFDSNDFRDYLSWSSLRHNIGRVYGGGFGIESTIWGSTSVVLDGDFRGFNVFGGCMEGEVSRNTNITIQGLAKVYNAVYGGGMRGNVGLDPFTGVESPGITGTTVTLRSGGIDRVYGGAFMGNVYGGSHINVTDEGMAEGSPRLLVGSVFGGNDVTGNVYEAHDTGWCTDIRVAEEPRYDKSSYTLSHPAADAPGKYYGGYPLVGSIYGSGNGNMADYIAGVTIDREKHEYNSGVIHIANGDKANIDIIHLGEMKAKLPDVRTSRITVNGGTIVNVYGGGSMCTTTERNEVNINYADTVARAGVAIANQDPLTWGVLRLFNDLQQSEVTTEIGDDMRFSYQIYRVFGGNNLMDMDIHPTLNLLRGHLFSVYSGGNFGRMTYPEGLELTINSPGIHLESVYGGGRVGDIDACDTDGTRLHFPNDKYGTTLNIFDGRFGDVYGGNNVAGHVYNGTRVNVHGSVEGNIYGAGNGNYIYKYDADNNNVNPLAPGLIAEGYDEDFGGRYFILPRKEAYEGRYYGGSGAEKILAINSYRPNVDKTYVNISGTEDHKVYVLGNVFCGGNSSTVFYDPTDPEGGKIKFDIGSYVTLGGVFLGSNGEGLTNPYHLAYMANLNDISDLNGRNDIAEKDGFRPGDKHKLHFNDQGAYDTDLYKNLLSLYMRAAEVTDKPSGFELSDNTVETNIGNFTVGGNRGSMMTDETIEILIPENVTIFGRVVGGCYNARLLYNGAEAEGGMTKPLKPGLTDKLHMVVKSKFRPWRLMLDPDTHEIRIVNDREDADGNYVADSEVTDGGKYYYSEGKCNIFGGCFTSGRTVGGITIELFSDVLGRYNNETTNAAPASAPHLHESADPGIMMNNVSVRRTVYALTGGGYGPDTKVEGDIHLYLLPQKTTGTATTHPSICTIFGGSHDGLHVGNSTTEVRDGMVFSSLYAGSRAAFKYGSSEVIVGYPKYYRCITDGIYTLDRADKYSYVARASRNGGEYTTQSGKKYLSYNDDDSPVIKETVKYRTGDIVAANVVAEINGYKATEAGAVTPIGENKNGYFTLQMETPATFESKWDNIDINIGDNSQMNNLEAPFYGGGGIYGGGHALNGSAMTYSGINTQRVFDSAHNPDKDEHSAAIGYGGNSTIIVGDNLANTDPTLTVGPEGEAIKDHISIGTGHYVEVKLDPVHGDKIGTYVKEDDGEGHVRFVHQSPGLPDPDVTYYKMETQGGIYGDGRRTFVQSFRAVDVTGYGYADYTPQHAKLINTFQRIDLLSLNDCCLQLQGANDYATNSVDATLYSLARIGELRLNSRLTGDLHGSVADPSVAGNMKLDVKRSRNYMGFFHNVHYIGAIYSSTPMEPESAESQEGYYRDANGTVHTDMTYKSYKQQRIGIYESITDGDTSEEKGAKELSFKQRNLATSPNMVGINNGYTLKVQNAFTTSGGTNSGFLKEVATDNIYYGPIIGVVEVKLLTVAQDEGGGYIYAFNQHDESHSFLESTGNFVHPAPIDEETDNYIVDDCYPVGYYMNHDTDTSEETHFWYVQGHHYYFNATLTAYTYNGPSIDFRLNNADNLILLSGISTDKADTIEIESIHWNEHTDDDYVCALTNDLDDGPDDSRSKYQMYLTIDSNPGNSYNLNTNPSTGTYENVGHAFVARIPNGNGPDAYGTAADGSILVHNNYSNESVWNPNSPLLGIRLHDTDSDNQDPTFFHRHLETPDNLVIKIKAVDNEGKENFYDIKLQVVYLQGPYIDGKVFVENCALPGEYIYANTSEVIAEMDESLTVTGKKWYLYPRVRTDLSKESYSWDDSEEGRVDVSQYLMQNISGTVNRIQLPARYYQNDWKVGYCIVVNGVPFPLEDPGDGTNLLTIHNYHRMSTVARAVKDMKRAPSAGDDGGDVTNYGFDIDLDLVGGALVYIEDDMDFEVFTKYVNYCNQVRRDQYGNIIYHQENGHDVATLIAEVLPGYNPYGYITGFTNGRTIEGYRDEEDVRYRNVKNPSGAENIRFVLNADVSVTPDVMPITEFRGQFNGNGHTISFNSNLKGKDFIDLNYGVIREVGFLSSGGENAPGKLTGVVKNNRGKVLNSYYYYFPENHPEDDGDYSGDTYSPLVLANTQETTADSKVTFTGTTDNCYQNTNMENANSLSGVRYRPGSRFHSGLVAYNLNQQYLKARYQSRDTDALVHEAMLDPDAGLDYLYNFYADGEYRYAYVKSPEHPEGLRLSTNFGVPNYENYMGNGQSMHIVVTDGERDDTRWFSIADDKIVDRDKHGNIKYDENGKPLMTNKGYFPIYVYDANGDRADHSDFIFFGQTLAPGAHRNYFPVRVNNTNRVYRASGFYGSREDLAFHFNRAAYAMEESLTAIDFTGYRDLDDTVNDGKQFKPRWQFYMKGSPSYTDNVYYEQSDDEGYEDDVDRRHDTALEQFVFYPPVLDLPGMETNNIKNLESFDIISNENINRYDKITKNLLVYTPEVDDRDGCLPYADSDRLFANLHYTRMMRWGDVSGETNQNDIVGHHIMWKEHDSPDLTSHFHSYRGLMHLVDGQNFNAPIEFYVAQDDATTDLSGRAWLLRKPELFANRIEGDEDVEFTISRDGWESIALPFTCNRVVAVNSGDYIKRYSRGQISHFYGSDPQYGITHHDYWLRGLVETAKDTHDGDQVVASADFARPGTSYTDGDGNYVKLFEVRGEGGVDEQMRGDYNYNNNWLYEAYADVDYNEHHNEYSKPLPFARYCYLTKNAPYIVAYPGPDYKEFDLSGVFYNFKHGTTGAHKQEILYEFTIDEIDNNNNFDSEDRNVRIPVTDDYDAVRHTRVVGADGTVTTHHATFTQISGTAITDDMYVLNTTDIKANVNGKMTDIPAGAAFINCNDFKIKEIKPFTTYITVEFAGPSPKPGSRMIVIGGGVGDTETEGAPEVEDEEPEEPQEASDEVGHHMEIWVEGNTLVVQTTYDTELHICNMLGQTVRVARAYKGINRYYGLMPGFYIVNHTKVQVK